MRPEDFSPGNTAVNPGAVDPAWNASMRPEDFSPGNTERRWRAACEVGLASMRPEDFSPGNSGPEAVVAEWRRQLQ